MVRVNSTTIPGVQQIRKASGTYYYHRKSGERIEAPYPSSKFDAELARLNGMLAAKEAAKHGPVAGTLGALIEKYRGSSEFSSLAERTRVDYGDRLDYLKPGAMALLDGFSRADVLAIRDKAHRTRSWHYANYLTTVLSVMFRCGVERGILAHNPCAGIVKIERPKQLPDANRPWSDEEREAVLSAAPSVGIKACIALGMFAGCREADAVNMTWESIGKDGWIRWKMQKTGDMVQLRIHPRLAEILKEARGDTIPLPTRRIVTGRQSRAHGGYTMNGFRRMFFKLIRKLQREGGGSPWAHLPRAPSHAGGDVGEQWRQYEDGSDGVGPQNGADGGTLLSRV